MWPVPGAVSMWRASVEEGQSRTQLGGDSYEEAIETLLNAQRMFKQEVDNQWSKLQSATRPLEQALQRVRQEQELQNRATAAGSRVHELSEAEISVADRAGLSDEMSKDGSAVGDPEPDMVAHSKRFKSAIEQTDIEFQLAERVKSRSFERWRRWLLSPWFDMCVAIAIVLNLLMMMFQLEYEGLQYQPNNYKPGSSAMDAMFDVIEQIFVAFFLLELMMRLLANGIEYLFFISNFLDALIVVAGCVDVWLLPSLMSGADTPNLSLLRVFRLLKLTKVLRVVRVVKSFAPLRVLVNAILSSMAALAWSMLLLFVLQITAALLLAQALQTVMRDESRDLQVRQKLWGSFGTMVRAWLSTFEMTFAPGAFMKHKYIFDEVNPGLYTLLVIYVCLVTFATIRVITALFLRNTLAAADKDTGEEVARVKLKRLAYSKSLSAHLEELEGEEPGQGRITENSLDGLMNSEIMSEWLLDADLSMTDARRLFKALDLGDGTAYISEYLAVLSQICDLSRDKEIILHYESAKVLQILSDLNEAVPDKKSKGPTIM